MNNFDFFNPTRIIFGKERLTELDAYVPKNVNVLVLYGGGSVKKFGTLQKVTSALGNRKYFEFGGIEPNPQFDTLMKAVEIIRKENIGFLLAVGGGSVMDGTKFIALAAKYEGNAEDILLKGVRNLPITKALPFGTVVTLPATGSEMNSGGVINYKSGKYVMGSPFTYPKFSFLDPELTFTLPANQVANGVVDSFVHVAEQYLTFPVDAKFQDRTAEGILQSLIEIGRKTIDEPTNYDARANLVWNATMALNGLLGAGVPSDWATHMIGHELTFFFGIDHAVSLAIVLPSLLNVRKDNKRAKLLQYAERVWKIDETNEDFKIDLAISKTREFFESLGIKTHLTDYNITEEDIDKVIAGLENKGMTALSETKDLNLEISRQILKGAL